MEQSLKAHQALSCGGYSRSDFIVTDKGPVYLETNTLPGLTKASLYPKALKARASTSLISCRTRSRSPQDALGSR